MNPSTFSIACISAALAVSAGCKKKDEATSEGSAPTTHKSVELPEPFEGELTMDLVKSASSTISSEVVYDATGAQRPWATVVPLVEARLGKAKVAREDYVAWGAMSGEDECGYLSLQKSSDGTIQVGGASGMLPDNMMKECREAAGAPLPEEASEAEEVELPEGNVELSFVLENYEASKASWKGKPVRFAKAYLGSHSRSSASGGDHFQITVELKDAAVGKQALTCMLPVDTELPETQKSPVVVEGTIDEAFGKVAIRDCKLSLVEGE